MSLLKTLFVFIIFVNLLFISCSSNDSEDNNSSIVTDQNNQTSENQQESENEQENEGQMEQNEEGQDDTPMGDLLASGAFNATGEYDITGNFEIIETEESRYIMVDNTFFVSGDVPDIVLYLSNETMSQENATFISEDVEDSGSQFFEIPEAYRQLEDLFLIDYKIF